MYCKLHTVQIDFDSRSEQRGNTGTCQLQYHRQHICQFLVLQNESKDVNKETTNITPLVLGVCHETKTNRPALQNKGYMHRYPK